MTRTLQHQLAQTHAAALERTMASGGTTVDVVKTRMMTQAASSLPPYKSVGDCIATIARDEGPRTFYTGLPQRSAYMGPLWALQFAGHDYLTKVFRRRNARRSSSRRH